MSWKDLKPLGRAILALNAAMHSAEAQEKKNCSLEIVIADDVLRRSDWKDGSWLKLQRKAR